MAHHQGMSIVALANVLLDGCAQRWGMANPHIEAVASLLHERAPREVSTLYHAAGQRTRAAHAGAARRCCARCCRARAVEPTQLLSNGRYSVALRANGAGTAAGAQLGITRWRDDALRDACGSFFYLRPRGTAAGVAHPAPGARPRRDYRSSFHADRVCFDAAGDLRRARHGLGQPGGRHRVPPGRAAQPGRPRRWTWS
jgi:cyclic beta-1,2-glucan synthetase